jgi:hypothetical protein
MKSNSSRDRSGVLDRIGTLVAAICALHCALLPLAFASVSSLTLALLSWKNPHHGLAIALLQASRWEWLVVSIALGLGGVSLVLGFARHRGLQPLALLLLSAGCFSLAIASPWSADVSMHAAFAVFGGSALAGAHLLNLRLTRAVMHAENASAQACAGHVF